METRECGKLPSPSPLTNIHIIRHGQALHNVDRGYPHRDPPLTKKGEDDARQIRLPHHHIDNYAPDLVLISPMTRTIQTAMLAFPSIFQSLPFKSDVQIWPDLREAHDAICNKGVSRTELMLKFPNFDFSDCALEWNYPPHTVQGAIDRAEAVRLRLKDIVDSRRYRNIAVVTHRGLVAYLVKGDRFDMCEIRSYRLATMNEVDDDALRFGTNVDTGEYQDFGPTLLVPRETDTGIEPEKGFEDDAKMHDCPAQGPPPTS